MGKTLRRLKARPLSADATRVARVRRNPSKKTYAAAPPMRQSQSFQGLRPALRFTSCEPCVTSRPRAPRASCGLLLLARLLGVLRTNRLHPGSPFFRSRRFRALWRIFPRDSGFNCVYYHYNEHPIYMSKSRATFSSEEIHQRQIQYPRRGLQTRLQ